MNLSLEVKLDTNQESSILQLSAGINRTFEQVAFKELAKLLYKLRQHLESLPTGPLGAPERPGIGSPLFPMPLPKAVSGWFLVLGIEVKSSFTL